MTPNKITKRPPGRPRIHPKGYSRQNINIVRTPEFDAHLLHIRERLAELRSIPLEDVTQTEVIQAAVKFYASRWNEK